MTTEYAWKPGARLMARIPAQVVGERLDELRHENEGQLTPEMVVDEARNHNSPLHLLFQWDDSAAAGQWRLHQARQVVNSVVVKFRRSETDEPRTIRAFVNIRTDDKPAYHSTVSAMSDDELRAKVLRKAWEELHQWRKRYGEYVEFAELFAVVDQRHLPPVMHAAE